MLLYHNSLAKTIENLNEAWFYSKDISKETGDSVSIFLAFLEDKNGSYAGLPAPTEQDFRNPEKRLFTGEKLRAAAGSAHILGEEALRAIIKLNSSSPEVREAIRLSKEGFECRLKETSEVNGGRMIGMYCCGICTVSYMRNLTIGTFKHSGQRLEASLKELKNLRNGSGRWRRFPFHYTILALSEINHSKAIDEIRYAASSLERIANRRVLKDKYAIRRKDLAQRALGII